jgi:hypothetical protein
MMTEQSGISFVSPIRHKILFSRAATIFYTLAKAICTTNHFCSGPFLQWAIFAVGHSRKCSSFVGHLGI